MGDPKFFDWWISGTDLALPLRVGVQCHHNYGREDDRYLRAVEVNVGILWLVLSWWIKVEDRS